MKNFIYLKDNFLSSKSCTSLIKKFRDDVRRGEKEYHGYWAKDLENTVEYLKLLKKLTPFLKKYIEKFPEINFTADVWAITNMRFKLFKSGQSFERWHSEHSFDYPTRLLNIMIYLTEHNCGTEFFNGDYIKSEIGRLVLFPPYFTHTHRGQKCPDNKTRYIITGYVNFIKR
tara:strand:+ start:329 stop:844 length:516 start_codon:yes stop_codon:yes gene_type:complete